MRQGVGRLGGRASAKWVVFLSKNTSNPLEQWKPVCLDRGISRKLACRERWHVCIPSCVGSLSVSGVEGRDWIVAWLWLLTSETARTEAVRERPEELQRKARRIPKDSERRWPPHNPYMSPQPPGREPSARAGSEPLWWGEWRIGRKDRAQICTRILQEERGKEQEEAARRLKNTHQENVDSDWIKS